MIVFVILHYKTINETLTCLDNLKNTFNKDDYKSVVVDNNTLNEIEIEKIKEYTDDIVLLNENLGFAKANNKGCDYAIKKYKPDFLAVINNDVFINQKDFINIIESDYQKYEFDMLGPWIDSRTGESCNPFPVIYGEKNIEESINKAQKLIKIYKSSLLYTLLNIYLSVKHKIRKPDIPTNHQTIEKGVALHGCAIVFSKKYYKKYQDVFFNETFLFHEEEFLYHRTIKDKLISIYDPELKVYHKEGSSVNKSKNDREVKLFKEKERIKSLELLLKEIR